MADSWRACRPFCTNAWPDDQTCDTALLRLAHAYDLQTRWVDRRPPPTALTGDTA